MKKAANPAIRKPKAKVSPGVSLLVATRKGAWLMHGDAARRNWRIEGPHFLGHIVSHGMLDPRDGRTLLAATKTGHIGPTMMRSTDRGRTWQEAKQPPAFAKAPEGEKGRAVDHTFWLTPGNRDQPNVWFAGTSPQGLFRTDDGGVTWQPFSLINDDLTYRKWMGTAQDGDGAWVRIGRSMPKPVGDIGFPLVVHPRNDKTLWVLPMDGTTVWPRTSPGGKPSVYTTKNAGKTWQRLDGRRRSRRAGTTVPRHPLSHDRRAGPDPAPHPHFPQWRAGARTCATAQRQG